MMTHTNKDTLISPFHTELIELSDDELDTLSGGAHHHRHHRHHKHGGSLAHAGSDFFKRRLTISAQTTTDAHGTTTSFSIELTEITSHSEH